MSFTDCPGSQKWAGEDSCGQQGAGLIVSAAYGQHVDGILCIKNAF